MEFLGIGYQELLLILVLLLLVVGPERLPAMAYQIGRAVRQMQQYARAVRAEFSDEISYLEEQYKTVKGEVDSTRQAIREHQTLIESEVREATASMDLPAIAASADGATISSGPPTATETATAVSAFGVPDEPGPAPSAKGHAANGADTVDESKSGDVKPAPPLVF
ncbi:MAG: twin-arginine translocase subunit TatB [Chloroflexi bacterium]|nr:twin-arginine translocase subunit TatB [Chloroflexota bacterium]